MRNAHTNSVHGQSGSTLTRGLADAQIAAHDAKTAGIGIPAVFRLYTEDKSVVRLLEANGFDGATLFHGTGVWQGTVEASLVIEILATLADRERIIRLARSIALANTQSEVLVTWNSSKGFDVARVFGK